MAVLLIGSFVFEELCNIMPAFFYVHIIDNVTYFAVGCRPLLLHNVHPF